MAHSNSDMNIDEAVSDIRPYQFEPLLGTASVVFNEESSDSDSDIDLDQQITFAKPRSIDKYNLVRRIQLIFFVILFAGMYYMILLFLHFADTSWTSGKWKENRINYSCRKGGGGGGSSCSTPSVYIVTHLFHCNL